MTHTASDMHDDSESTAPLKPEALKPAPCPFCGSADKPTLFGFDGEPYVPGFEIRCDASGWEGMDGKGCGATSGWGETPAEALEAWNRRAPLAASPAPQQQGVKVKALEWTRPINSDKLSRAETDLGIYRAYTHHDANGRWFWSLDGYQKASGETPSEEAAKSAAQSDYEARILSALSIQEPASEPVAWRFKHRQHKNDWRYSRSKQDLSTQAWQQEPLFTHPPAPAVPADLVERLRARASQLDHAGDGMGYYSRHDVSLDREAASAIASLAAELASTKLHLSAWEDSARINKHRVDEAEAALASALDELKHLMAAYVGTLEIGRDRIMGLGGTCDPVDVMEAGDPALRRAKAFLAATLQSQRPE